MTIIATVAVKQSKNHYIDYEDKVTGKNMKDVKQKLAEKGYPTKGSPVYVDTKDGKTVRVGWVKNSRDKYEDTGKSFVKETWVSLYEQRPLNLDRKKSKLKAMS